MCIVLSLDRPLKTFHRESNQAPSGIRKCYLWVKLRYVVYIQSVWKRSHKKANEEVTSVRACVVKGRGGGVLGRLGQHDYFCANPLSGRDKVWCITGFWWVWGGGGGGPTIARKIARYRACKFRARQEFRFADRPPSSVRRETALDIRQHGCHG